jgi:hypothetical protein
MNAPLRPPCGTFAVFMPSDERSAGVLFLYLKIKPKDSSEEINRLIADWRWREESTLEKAIETARLWSLMAAF